MTVRYQAALRADAWGKYYRFYRRLQAGNSLIDS